MFKLQFPLIFLVLGNSCNMKCNYCIRDDNEVIHTPINPELYKFLDSIDGGERRTITFYGGEPTIYFKEIKEIVLRKRDKFFFSTMTNGKAITYDMVNFFNLYFQSVNLSWDGYNSKLTRGYDSLNENIDVIKRIKNLWLTGVITKYSYPLDMLNAYREFDEKYYRIHKRHINIHLNVPIKSFESDIFDVDFDRVEREVAQILNYEGNDYVLNYVKNYTLFHENRKLKGTNPTYLTKCGSSLALGIDGTIYACKNSCIKLGDINSDYRRILEKLHSYNVMDKSECENCKIFKLCRGGCYFPNDKDYFCKGQLAIWGPAIDYLKRGNEK